MYDLNHFKESEMYVYFTAFLSSWHPTAPYITRVLYSNHGKGPNIPFIVPRVLYINHRKESYMILLYYPGIIQ